MEKQEELQLFNFHDKQVRTLSIKGEPYFVATDVTKILGLTNTTVALSRLDDDERSKFNLGRQGQTNIVNEYGLYELILASRKSEAHEFKRWITHEVLPTIRKHGAYMTEQKIKEVLLNPDTIIQLATELKEERTGRLIAEQQVHELKPKATYYDKVLQSKGLVPITLIAKDYGMSGTAMNNLLHELKVIYKMGSTWLLYAPYQSLGWTSSQTFVVDKPDGTQKTIMQTKWTQQGRLGLYGLLKSKKNLVPVIERTDAKK